MRLSWITRLRRISTISSRSTAHAVDGLMPNPRASPDRRMHAAAMRIREVAAATVEARVMSLHRLGDV